MNAHAPRALIAEDEPVLATALANALHRLWPGLQIAAVAENGIEAVEAALLHQPQFLFLDITMPGKTGLEVAEELAEEWPAGAPFPLIVFVTAFDEYALQAFEHAAIDYVLKPVSDERLKKTLDRLKTRLASQQTGEGELSRAIARLQQLAPLPATERLSIIRAGVGNQVRMIPVEEVLYFEAADKYVNVVTAEGDYLIRASLRELQPQLDPQRFWQVHRGTIVNAGCIQAALRDETGKLSLSLRNRTERLTVSRVYAHRFRQM
ncbi:MAG: response regulator transcription factor [Paucimonas sp.]|jgi:DNA-binding LytR/AlgR family response regulator|nr:response regulator transcription factor [Paucimonas sp.]